MVRNYIVEAVEQIEAARPVQAPKSVITKNCKSCSKAFEVVTEHSKGKKYCSKLCAQKIRYGAQKKKWAQGMASGELYGKPFWMAIYARYARSAKERDVVFSLSYDDFLSMWQKPCSYCGGAIETIGIDRMDNEYGYQLDNVVPCCTNCNLMKRAMKPEDYVAHCVKVCRTAFPLMRTTNQQ